MRLISCLVAVATLGAGVANADIFIPDGDTDSVLYLDGGGKIITRIDGLGNVHGLALAPEPRLLVAGSLSQQPRRKVAIGAVDAIDTDEIDMSSGVDMEMNRPEGMSDAEHNAHHGTGGDAMASDSVSIVTLLNADTHDVQRRIEVAGMVHHVAVDASETHAPVTHPGLGGVSIITLADGAVTGPIATGPNPEYSVFDPETGRFFVSNAGNATISEIDASEGIVIRNMLLQSGLRHLKLLSDEPLLVAAEAETGFVSLIDIASGDTVDRFEIGGTLHGVQADRNAVYVSARGRDQIVRIDRATAEKAEMSIEDAYHLALSAHSLLVGSSTDPMVYEIDQATLDIMTRIETGGIAHQIVVGPSP